MPRSDGGRARRPRRIVRRCAAARRSRRCPDSRPVPRRGSPYVQRSLSYLERLLPRGRLDGARGCEHENLRSPMDHYQLLIDGRLTDAASGERYTTIDPSTGQPLASVAAAGRADVDAAVGAARRAFTTWSTTTPLARAEVVMDLADRMQAAIARLGFLEMCDSGGLLSRTTTDVFAGARFLRTMARYAAHEFPWTENVPGKNPFFPGTSVVRREPIGVCAAIIPWNFPLLMACWKLGMALVTGNTIVIKPSPETPLSALELGKIVASSRVPAGVINVVTGPDRTVGELLVKH